ncbi:hypothetical protein D3H65_30685 [Paraflavitalea soli]|uniref:Uncharacterized protein n=1 Tax=Paraflavitalea soli TaxID=2315862 RepID=A0A3B7MU76_9BACT|nr:hypothetical protein [Paraflavitalea soli]AXY78094.1 hypothetical protein D3H65_30685 [Paraflavitalea soli]
MNNDEKYLHRVIHPRHIQIILDMDSRQARRELKEIRESLGKEEHQYIILKEFLKHSGLQLQSVLSLLGWGNT